MKTTFSRLWDVYRPFSRAILGMLGFLLLQELIVLVDPMIYGRFIDALIAKHGFSTLVKLTLLWFCLGSTESVVGYLKYVYELKEFDYEFPRSLAGKTLAKFLKFSVGQHTNQHSGVQQNVINEGEGALSRLSMTMLYATLPPLFKAVIVSAYLFYVNLTLGVITTIGMILYVAVSVHVNKETADELKEVQDLWNDKHKAHSEIIRNPDLIELNAKEEYSITRYDEKVRVYGDKGIALWRRYVRWMFFAQSAVPDVTNYVIILTGAFFVYQGTLTLGKLVTIMAMSSMSMRGLSSLAQMQRQLSEEWQKIAKYFTLMEVEPDVKVVANPIEPKAYQGTIEFRDVTFAYPVRSYIKDDEETAPEGKSDEPVLEHLSLTIRQGESIALVGKNGAGKSTFFHLLMRSFDPDKGQVLIDGNDLRLLDLANYRKHGVGFVEQDVRLFDATLRENIFFGLNGQRATLTEADITKTLSISRMASFLPKMEQGLDTLIGEKGIKLSGGQRKMVGIARAIIKNPAVFLFDEATAGLDQEEEALLYESLHVAAAGRTTLIITHRLSTVENVDRILVLEKGKIVGDGPHKELIHSCSAYQDLLNHQIASF